jgi:asparagine synthase (glutamine-hydrolysing)
MSAIFGVVYFDGRSADRERLDAMSARLAHRGSDGEGVYCEGPVGLGHRLSFTTPESLRERQPLNRPDAPVILVADARVDNRDELIAALSGDRGVGAASTDSELILAAYLRWGEQGIARIVGDFALVFWDERSRTLLCARDAMGVKPLYYYRSDRSFAFASEIKALLCLPEVPRRIDEVQVACFLETHLHDREITFYQGIRRLPAAHHMRVARARAQKTRYWELDPERELRLGGDAEYAEAFREHFTEAVRASLRSAFPVVSTLSGGLDSSSVTCVARDLEMAQGREFHTVSAVFTGLPEDERRLADESQHIDAVIQTGGLVSHRVQADAISPFHEFDRALWHLDEAPIGFNMYMHAGLYDAAAAHGARVFLDGYDGDGCVSHGTERLDELLREDRWDVFDAEVAAMCERLNSKLPPDVYARHFTRPHLEELATRRQWGRWLRAAREVHVRYGVSRRRLLIRHGVRALLPDALMRTWRERRGGGAAVRSLVDPGLAARVGLAERQRAFEYETGRRLETPRLEHKRSLENPLYQYGLELFDKTAAARGIEARYPFFDRRLMEFCLSLPAEQKLSGGWSRAVMRRALAGTLPASTRTRIGKQNLSPNFRRGLRTHDRPLVERALGFATSVLDGYANLVRLRETADRFLGPHGTASNADATLVYRAVSLAHWLAGGAWESPESGRPISGAPPTEVGATSVAR